MFKRLLAVRAPFPLAVILFAASLAAGLPIKVSADSNPLGQEFRIAFEDFQDSNSNGLIDCYETVRFRFTVFDLDSPPGESVTGRISLDSAARWSFQPGTVQIDNVLTDSCLPTAILGDSPSESGAVVDYNCTTSPTDDDYLFSFFASGVYTGITGAYIQVNGSNDTFSPAAYSTDEIAITSQTRGCAQPDLVLTKSDAGAVASPGSVVSYSLAYSNQGSGSSSPSILSDVVPANTSFEAALSSSGWACSPSTGPGSTCTLDVGFLPPGATGSRAFAVRVAVPLPDSVTQLTNTATITASDTDSDPSNNSATDTTPVNPGNPDLRLTKSLQSGSPEPGGTLVYSLSITNLGNRTATSVLLSETVPASSSFSPAASSPGWSCSPNGSAGSACTLAVPDIAPGATLARIFAVVLASPLPATSILNTACSSTSTPGDPQSNNCSTTTTPTTGSPALTIAKSDGGISAAPGDVIAYTINFSNSGPANAPGVILSETVPSHTTFNTAASSPGWTCSPNSSAGSTCTLSFGALVSGGSASRAFAVTVVPILPASVTQTVNTITISSSAADDPADNTATDVTPLTPGTPNLSLTKTLVTGPGTPGSLLVYDLTVQNTGNRAAEPLDFVETVPTNTSFNAGSSSSGWTCTPDNSQGSTCTLTLPSLAAGASATRIFAVMIVDPLPSGVTSISNTACVSTPTPGNPPADDCSTVLTPASGSPSLDLVKTIASGSATPGTTLAYALTVTNGGNQAASAVVLSETVPTYTVFSSGASSPGWTCTPNSSAGSSCTLSIGTLAGGGASASRAFAVVVDDPLPAEATVISNTACASAQGSVSCDDVDAPTDASPLLSVSKSLQSGSASPGSTLTYSIAVQNTGNQAAGAVHLTESVPLHTSFQPAASSAGWACSPNNEAGATCSISLGALAVGATSTRTFAVAVANPLPAGVTSISNVACAALATSGSPVCDDFDTPVVASPVLNIVKTITTAASPGGPILYTIAVHNTGNQNASGVSITDQVPAYGLFDPATSSPDWTCSPNSSAGSACSLSVGALAAGQNLAVTFGIRLVEPLPADATSLTNLACVTDDAGAYACSSVTTPIAASPDLILSKTGPSEPLEAGQVLLFSLHVINNGNRVAADVLLTDTVPKFTSFNAAASSPGWSCPSIDPGALCSIAIGNLPPGISHTAVFAVTAAAPLPEGVVQVSNTACAQSPDATACDDAATPLPSYVEARLVDTLQTDHNRNGYPDPGDVLGYTLLVDNPSPRLLTDLVVTAELDQHLSFVEGSVTTTAGTAPSSPALLVTLPSLASGDTVTITFLANVLDYPDELDFLASQGAVSGGNFTTEPTDDPDTHIDDDPTLTPLSPEAEIAEIPTLSEIGLLIMVFILGTIALMTIRP